MIRKEYSLQILFLVLVDIITPLERSLFRFPFFSVNFNFFIQHFEYDATFFLLIFLNESLNFATFFTFFNKIKNKFVSECEENFMNLKCKKLKFHSEDGLIYN